MNSTPKISVVTVTYNSAATLEETMLSVLNQTYPNIEYIIIDGGSTDGTVDIIKKYVNRLAYWVSEPDQGIYDAMNKGIAVAGGDYINFMNSGDKFYDSNTIESIFDASHEEDVIYGDTLNISNLCSYIEHCLPLEEMKRILPFGHQSTFVKSTIIRENLFNLHYKSASDYNQLFQIWKKGANFLYLPHIISVFDARDGFSALNKQIVLREVAEINGSINERGWYKGYRKKIIIWKIKKEIRKLLPKFLIKKRNQRNIRKFGQNPRITIYEIF